MPGEGSDLYLLSVKVSCRRVIVSRHNKAALSAGPNEPVAIGQVQQGLPQGHARHPGTAGQPIDRGQKDAARSA
jgi:hypothetical protein